MNEFKLSKKPKITSGHTIPEGYFDTLSANIFLQTTNRSKPTSVFRINTKWKMAIAAILVIGLFCSVYFMITKKSDEIEVPIIENYIVNNTEINQYDLISELEISEINAIKVNLEFEDQHIEALLDSNIKIENLLND